MFFKDNRHRELKLLAELQNRIGSKMWYQFVDPCQDVKKKLQ